jgi:poly(hydroxyalkanoate) granule associated protein phasin
MLKSTLNNLQSNRLSEAALAASRQVWLAGLGAAVVTRDWVQHEAGAVFKSLVRQGTTVESRAIRVVGDRIETSMNTANTLWKRTRSTVESTVKSYADQAVAIAQSTLPRSLPKIELARSNAVAAKTPAKRGKKRVVRGAPTAKQAKRVAKRAAKR